MTVTKEKFYIIKPKAGINLCTNPSMEGTTTGWTPGGTNTVACDATVQTRGVYSMKCTYSNDDIYAYSPITITDAVHVASIDVYVPTSYTGTKLVFYFMSFTSSTPVDGEVDMTIRDRWQTVTCSITPDSGDLSGYISINEDGVAAGVGEYFYIDGCQVEIGSTPTTYFDGNISETINGVRQYYWTGADNGSTSVRLATTRSGGELIDITDYCKKIDVIGLGMAPTDVNSIGLVDGTKRYQRTNLTSRYFTLAVAFNGTSIGTVQTNRNALIDLVKPDLVPYQQPLIIRYQGETDAGLAASEPINIKCTYVSGLDTGLQRDFERANIVFEIHDSYLQKAYDSGAELGYQTTVEDVGFMIQQSTDGVWSDVGGGFNDIVRCFAIHPITGYLYIGGDFTDAGDANGDRIVYWDGSSLHSLSTGIGNGAVRALAFDAAGNLYIGGTFTNIGDADGDNITMWDGSSFNSLSIGLSNTVYALAINRDGYVYIGGAFIDAGGANGDYIVYWDGAAFNALSTGLTDNVYALAYAGWGELYIGGAFTNIGDANGDYITMWNGSSFNSLSTGLTDNVYTIAVSENGDVYVGGDYLDAGLNLDINYISRWDGTKFNSLGTGTLQDAVHTLTFDSKGNLYLGGEFTTAAGIEIPDRVCIWNGSRFIPIDVNLADATALVYAMLINPKTGELYIGGDWAGTDAYSAIVTVTNVAGAKTYPVIKVTGPGTLWQIKNYTTNKAIYFDGLTLLAGEVVTLDLRPGRIKMTSTFRGSILFYVVPGSSYDFPLMPGNNNVSAYLYGSTTAASNITMQWVENYHGIDGAQYA